MKPFEAPELKIRIFEDRDIITTSPTEESVNEGTAGEDELPIH